MVLSFKLPCCLAPQNPYITFNFDGPFRNWLVSIYKDDLYLSIIRLHSLGTFAVMSLMIKSVVEKANCGGLPTQMPTNATEYVESIEGNFTDAYGKTSSQHLSEDTE